MTRMYRPRVSTYWWLSQRSYLKFILREISSVFVAWFVVLTLLQIRALSSWPQAYAEFQQWLKAPFLVALNVVSFFFVVFHAVTWFNLTPRAMVIRIRGKRLPEFLVAGPNYVVWLVVSGVIAWILLGG
jgi:fumarate reductase subunit C